MNRWMRKVVLLASLSGGLVVAGSGLAAADATGDSARSEAGAHHAHHEGLLAQALKLDSLSSGQRVSVEQLVQARRAAGLPAREADARVLAALAQQVDTGTIDPKILAPTVQAKESAELAAHAAELDLTKKLHDLLTPAQRSQLVDSIEAGRADHAPRDGGSGGRHGEEFFAHLSNELGLSPQQTQQIAANLKADGHDPSRDEARPASHRAWLESFRSDAFDASLANAPKAAERFDRQSRRMERVLEAAVPVLTQGQRTELASRLRARAAHESHS